MATFDDLKTYVDIAVDYSRDKIEGAIVHGNISSGSQIRFSEGSIDIGKIWESFQLKFFFIIDGSKTGYSERFVNSEDEVRTAVDDTISFSRRLPDSMFFAGVESKISEYRDVSANYDRNIDGFTEKAPQIVNSTIDAAISEGAKRVAGALKFSKAHSYFHSSYGPFGETAQTKFDLNVRAFQEELDYSGQGLNCGTKPMNSEKQMIEAGAQAGRLSKQAIGAKQGEPGTYDVVMNPTVAANVIGLIPDVANPFMVMIGMSPLGDKMGEQIGPEFVTVTDNPWIPDGLKTRAFDFEGTVTRQNEIISKGVLKLFVQNTSSAAIFETNSTGSSEILSMGSGVKMLLPNTSNLVFDNGDRTVEELLNSPRPTIYVTCNWYTTAQNYQTGDISTIPRDAMFLIEKGEMTPIKNLRISDNTLRMFANIDAIADDRKQIYWWEVETPTFIPSMRIKDCRLTAATQ
ncbi:MAG: TldD/PmbA family protein [Candidatus Thorarchaeota archaeon]